MLCQGQSDASPLTPIQGRSGQIIWHCPDLGWPPVLLAQEALQGVGVLKAPAYPFYDNFFIN